MRKRLIFALGAAHAIVIEVMRNATEVAATHTVMQSIAPAMMVGGEAARAVAERQRR
jgi:hypothetical protein